MTAPNPIPAATEAVVDDRILRITRVFDASPLEVYRAFTVPEHLVMWWGPEGHGVPECSMDVTVGGSWRTVMISPEGDRHVVSGVYRELVEPSRLAFTWSWETAGVRGHETLVTVELRDRNGRTELTLTQRLFESTGDRDNHDFGWGSSFVDLDRVFASS